MNVLVDTCAFIWLITEPERVSPEAQRIFENQENTRFFSIVSVWETMLVAEKNTEKNKGIFLGSSSETISKYINEYEVNILPLREDAIYSLEGLPHHHKDPFDRMLICQALAHDLTILTPDENFRRYGVKVAW